MGYAVKTDRGGVSFHTVGVEIELNTQGFFPRLQVDGWEDLDVYHEAVKGFGEERADKLAEEIEGEINTKLYLAWLAWERKGRPTGADWGPIQSVADLLDDHGFNGFIPDDLEEWWTERFECLLSRETAGKSPKGARR